MKKIDFVDIFKKALAITWSNKILWGFGFFLLGGTFSLNYNLDTKKIFQTTPWAEMPSWIYNADIIVALGIAVLLVVIFFYVMKILSTASIIRFANNIPVYRNSSFLLILKESRRDFWTLFLLNIGVVIASSLIFFVMLAPIAVLFSLKANILGFIALMLGIIIFVPLVAMLLFLKNYAYLYAVIGKNKMRKSVDMAYSLLRENIKESLLMALFSIVALLVFSTALLFTLVSILIIAGAVCVIMFFINKILALIVGVIFTIIVLIALLSSASFAQAFLQVSWVFFFQKIAYIKDKEKSVEESVIILENVPDAGTV